MLLAEIARKARVSPATVSRAINQPKLVAPASLARIRAVMQQCNYVPAPAASRRGPKSREQERRRIGVWFVGANASNPSHNWFHDQLLQVQAADPHYRVDVRLLFTNSPDELPRNLANEDLDGIILQGMQPSPGCLKELGNVPHVWFMTRRSADYAGDYVEPNNEENGRMAAEYLKAHGHREVAIIASDPDYSAIASRSRAFTERAKELGLTVHPIFGRANPGVSYLEIAPLHGESGALVHRLLDAAPGTTGLYLPADHFCGSFFRALREAGKQPGRDFDAILGNYNPVIYHNLDHSPAAIDINLSTLIRKVVDHLLWRIDNPTVTGRIGVLVSPRLLTFDPAKTSTK
ncbi:LacI family DNA-binding transcriptional regulator [Opitutus terrae]|uniref:Transcriptional regulator, LacI family n=1 Tax=Opitutus terrae (strain DSM 11246 / JCM 15787 / PB90-1) TaxID=452637 RepID=B1ZY34_OPITP|nr:LacI family DNA-binding transcriptional regulator [Opitutus terrae]ACB76183.1 transcriptional regulator, LacI family [Opitutus terrae PB90-1]